MTTVYRETPERVTRCMRALESRYGKKSPCAGCGKPGVKIGSAYIHSAYHDGIAVIYTDTCRTKAKEG